MCCRVNARIPVFSLPRRPSELVCVRTTRSVFVAVNTRDKGAPYRKYGDVMVCGPLVFFFFLEFMQGLELSGERKAPRHDVQHKQNTTCHAKKASHHSTSPTLVLSDQLFQVISFQVGRPRYT